MATRDDNPALLLYVLKVSPETATRRWSASLLGQSPGRPVEEHEFDNPLALARFLAQVSMHAPPREGLR
ncbi:MAG TPA: hypothetical protein PLW72_03130 [Burkholderiaceae bacterium]|nr:hypothetical protein [Burkholderiaceae bacterium]HQR77118.1 hypothetical protein [Burkholderiaceae bacterium]